MYYCCDVVLWLAMRLCDSIDMTYHCCNIVLWLAIRLCVPIDDVTSYNCCNIALWLARRQCDTIDDVTSIDDVLYHVHIVVTYCAVVGKAAVRLN